VIVVSFRTLFSTTADQLAALPSFPFAFRSSSSINHSQQTNSYRPLFGLWYHRRRLHCIAWHRIATAHYPNRAKAPEGLSTGCA
jgi:hypothetical protein